MAAAFPLATSATTTSEISAWHQPVGTGDFRCVGAACEDTCCRGMAISVDESTYGKYHHCSDAELKPKLQQFITIQPAPTARNFAAIQLQDAECPFLSENLCSIQARLGEDYLSHVCATYPRVINAAPVRVERSLDLSCPEAAQQMLLRPEGIRFEGQDDDASDCWQVRKFILAILQNRRYSISSRVLLVGHVCSKLSEIYRSSSMEKIAEALEGFDFAINAGLFDAHLQRYSASPVPQLAVALELVVGRIQLDYVSPRFLELYNDFTAGLGLTPESTLESLGKSYCESYDTSFLPFVQEHEYILENYLVACAYKNQFPFGNNETARTDGRSEHAAIAIEEHYMLLATSFSLARTLMIGVAATRRDGEWLPQDAVRVLQIFSRAMDHCTTFPTLVLDTLAAKGIKSVAGMAMLSQSIATPKQKAAQI